MSSVLFELREGAGCITFNRPEKLNSFNGEMALNLQKILDDCRSTEIRAVYITGSGKAFSAGQDIEELTGPNPPSTNKILAEHFNPVITKIKTLEKPVVAAVNGVAAGAGANIALCCDVVVATKNASFIQAFSKIGLIPDSGGTYFLPRLIGWQKASALMMLGEKISAEEAEKSGMIYKYFEDDEFAESAFSIAKKLAQMPTTGLAFTKKALQSSFTNTLDEQLMLEDQLQQLASETHDYKEGVQAFMEKRKPIFNGK